MSAETTPTTEQGQPHRLPEELIGKIAAGAVSRELERELPFEPIRMLDAAGFGALRVPAEYGGPGLSIEELITELIRLAEADSNVAHLYRGHFGFVEALRFQPEEIRAHWYRKVLEGKTVGNASTEKGGNALGELNTVLTEQDGTPVLTGEKFYCTGTIFSDYTRVSASRAGGGRKFAVVAVDAPGVTVHDDWDGFGQRLTGTGTTEFDGVEVEPHGVLDRVVGGHEAVHEAAFFQLYLLAAQVGVAKAAVRDAADLVRKRRRTFNTSGTGQLFKEDPLIQQIIGTMSAKAFAAEATVLEAARIQDRALQAGLEAGTDRPDVDGELPLEIYDAEIAVEQAHVCVPELVISVTQELFQTVGASATMRPKALDRH